MTKEEHAIEILRDLVRQWYTVDGTSASDLLDEIANNTVAAGIVSEREINRWMAEEGEQAEEDANG